MANVTYLTEEGMKKLNDELNRLIAIERPNISRQIAEAREKGDLSENAEYDAAKEAQGMLELKIAKLQETIKNSRVLDKSQIQSDKVQILSKVKLLNTKMKKEVTYTIVAGSEANLKEGKSPSRPQSPKVFSARKWATWLKSPFPPDNSNSKSSKLEFKE